MTHQVIIFSKDEIRGNILFNSLTLNGLSPLMFSSQFEARKAIPEHSPSVIIYDARDNLSNELYFLQRLSIDLPKAKIIVLTEQIAKPLLDNLGMVNVIGVPDPLDPELIFSRVKEILASSRKLIFRLFLRKMMGSFVLMRRVLLRSLPILIALSIGAAGGYIYWSLSNLPEIEILKDYSPFESSKLYSDDNILLSELYVERRTHVPHEETPDLIKNAFIAVEDNNYFKHHGVDFFRTMIALFQNIKARSYVQGGSTITQQLAKMLFLTPDKTITRKIQEIALALKIEKKYSKDEILGLYLNQAYFGTRAYGLEAATETYFGKPVSQLSLSEAALLAAIPNSPTTYSPFMNPEKARQRRNYILNRMLSVGFITEQEYMEAIKDDMPKIYHGTKYKAPYFVDHCRSVLEKRYGDRLSTAGLKIYTTLDYGMQQIAEKSVNNGIEELKKRGIDGVNVALLALEVKTGRIKAMVGGVNFWTSQYNRATQARRQSGSSFKPIVYLAALNKGFNPDDEILDEKVSYWHRGELWTPHNYADVYHGYVTLRRALASSLNTATVNLGRTVGLRSVINTAKEIGIKSTIHPYYSSILGASEVTLLELIGAYAAFSHGKRVEPTCIDRIIDRQQSAVLEPSGLGKIVINQRVLSQIKQMLRTVVLNGTGRRAKVLDRTVYGKTGTTNDFVDTWFVGFDDNLAVGVWVGRDNHTSIGKNETGSRTALPIWIEFMKNVGR